MNWQDELKVLGGSGVARKRNSPLKKKLSIIKKLKNISSEDVDAIRNDLALEDMSKFTSEIVSSLLLTKVQSENDIKNVVRVTSALVACGDFARQLTNELGKAISHGIQDAERYWLAAYFFDLQTLTRETTGKEGWREGLIKDLCSKMDVRPRVLFLWYMKESYKDDAIQAEITIQANKVEPLAIEDDEKLAEMARSLGIEVHGKGDGFKKMIGVEDEEFHYYTGRTSSLECYSGSLDAKEIRDYIIIHSGDSEKLDALSRCIKNASNQKEIISAIIQLKLNPNLITPIARILKSMGGIGRKVVSALFKEIYQSKSIGHNDVVSNCLLISEMCKFKEASADEMFGLLDYLFKVRNIEAYCACLNGIGRYFLLNESTNHRIREFIERIRNYKTSKTDFIHANNCLSRVFSPSQTMLNADYRGFFRHFFRKEVFSEGSPIWTRLVRSKATLVTIFLHPWAFEDIDFLASLVHRAGVQVQMIEVVLSSIEIMYVHSRHKCIALGRLYSSLMLLERKDKWPRLIDKAFRLEIDTCFKCKIIIILLQKMPIDIQRQYFPIVRACVDSEDSLDLRILFSNFCESIGVEPPGVDYEDSFDEELNFIRSYA
ncbi:putative U2 snRNP component Hsh115 [Encephalitozoon hellem]|uniref:U2 snRNP component Hsh115 n=1 Tax=Encephalitozoon hellem TaxID=27973 RepID=A0ABY8CKL7_ENCHE|nr:putative U2 snRNP component Hsh115 [Encephalitozoon hellem]